jgi:hypothetical protein
MYNDLGDMEVNDILRYQSSSFQESRFNTSFDSLTTMKYKTAYCQLVARGAVVIDRLNGDVTHVLMVPDKERLILIQVLFISVIHFFFKWFHLHLLGSN